MVNTEDFVRRLNTVMEFYSISASTFADKIGVQRSSVSHLLSGRNKPSLDFILKILESFPEVDLYWILNGKGSFPKKINIDTAAEKTQHQEIAIASPTPFVTPEANLKKAPIVQKIESSSVEIDRIVIFYKNGTFKEYQHQA